MIDIEKKRARIEYYKTPRRQAYVKAYRRNNRDKFRGYWDKWYMANREKLSEMRAKFYQENKEKVLARNKEWRWRNPEKVYAYEKLRWQKTRKPTALKRIPAAEKPVNAAKEKTNLTAKKRKLEKELNERLTMAQFQAFQRLKLKERAYSSLTGEYI